MACNNPKCPVCYPKNKPMYDDCPEYESHDHEYGKRKPMHDGCYNRKPHHKDPVQTHVHEFAGSVMKAGSIPHTHRFAGVTSEKIPYNNSHVHAILVNTDFFFNHYHEVGKRTGPAIPVGNGKHIHVVRGETTTNFGHDHDFIFTTFIENPLQYGDDD